MCHNSTIHDRKTCWETGCKAWWRLAVNVPVRVDKSDKFSAQVRRGLTCALRGGVVDRLRGEGSRGWPQGAWEAVAGLRRGGLGRGVGAKEPALGGLLVAWCPGAVVTRRGCLPTGTA